MTAFHGVFAILLSIKAAAFIAAGADPIGSIVVALALYWVLRNLI